MPDTTIIERSTVQKNTDGHLGPKCNNCGGFGFTLGFEGRDHGCQQCGQTGVAAMSNAELQREVIALHQKIDQLSAIILKELGNEDE